MDWLTRLAEESNLEQAVNDCYRGLSLMLGNGCMVARHNCASYAAAMMLCDDA